MREVHWLEDLGAGGIRELVSLAGRLRERPEPRALEGKVLALLVPESLAAHPGVLSRRRCPASGAVRS